MLSCERLRASPVGGGVVPSPTGVAPDPDSGATDPDGASEWLSGEVLDLGSADPHRTGAPDGVATRRPCAPAMSAHVPASDAELLSRRFASANVAPCTVPLPPPDAMPVHPPRVTSVEQVVPRRSLALVRAWMRRLRRSMRMARAGNLSGAWRMRPQDLWLGHAEHSCPETAPWDWDLRPLDWGAPAVPLQVSGVDGVRPACGLDLAAVLAAADGFTDKKKSAPTPRIRQTSPHSLVPSVGDTSGWRSSYRKG